MFFLLFLVLTPLAGDPEPLKLGGSHTYKTLEACHDDADRMSNWLKQDMVSVSWNCQQIIVPGRGTNGERPA
jgi:hypothetical protein